MSALHVSNDTHAQIVITKQDFSRQLKQGGGACRKGNYTVKEKECFLEIMEDYKHIIEARGNSAESRWQKEQAWENIAIRYNGSMDIDNVRDRSQLAILWKNLKARCKHEMATAVDPNTIAPPDPIGQRVASLVRRGKHMSDEVEANKCFGILGGAGIKIESNGFESEDGSGDAQSNVDTTSPSTSTRPDAEDNKESAKSAVDLSQANESRKRKRSTPDRVVVVESMEDVEEVQDLDHIDNLTAASSGSNQTEETEPEMYPKGVVVVQPTAVEDDPAPREDPVTVVSVAPTDSVPVSNQRVLYSINPNHKKGPVPILPKITAVHSGYIPISRDPRAGLNQVNQPQRHTATPYERPQNRQRQTLAPLAPRPPAPPRGGGFDAPNLLESHQQEEHEAKMELLRLQMELATAQLRMAEEEHRLRFAKLQVELQTAQMEHDAKANQLSVSE